MQRRMASTLITVGTILASAAWTHAGVVVYEEGDKKLEVGGRVQIQYLREDPDGGDSSDTLFFRRLRPYVLGTVTKNWLGKIQFDFGNAGDDDEIAVKDAYLQYRGWNNHTLTIGNAKPPFSREFLTSSKRQQLVERSFAGDHNFGSPDRALGLKLDGRTESKKVAYAVSLGQENHDPDAGKMDFDTPANNKEDWNEGVLVAARVDFHPLGLMKYDQANFRSEDWLFTVSGAGFFWSNDDDNNTFTDPMGMALDPDKADLDEAQGFEVSGGVRGRGFSADLEYQMVSGDTVDPTFTGGLYAGGTTDLDILAVEAGYLLPTADVEFVGGWDSLDADNYTDKYERTSVGLNWYWNKHKAKVQLTYRMEENVDGVPGVDQDLLYVQTQFVF